METLKNVLNAVALIIGAFFSIGKAFSVLNYNSSGLESVFQSFKESRLSQTYYKFMRWIFILTFAGLCLGFIFITFSHKIGILERILFAVLGLFYGIATFVLSSSIKKARPFSVVLSSNSNPTETYNSWHLVHKVSDTLFAIVEETSDINNMDSFDLRDSYTLITDKELSKYTLSVKRNDMKFNLLKSICKRNKKATPQSKPIESVEDEEFVKTTEKSNSDNTSLTDKSTDKNSPE